MIIIRIKIKRIKKIITLIKILIISHKIIRILQIRILQIMNPQIIIMIIIRVKVKLSKLTCFNFKNNVCVSPQVLRDC